jgi:hypothetical protein
MEDTAIKDPFQVVSTLGQRLFSEIFQRHFRVSLDDYALTLKTQVRIVLL